MKFRIPYVILAFAAGPAAAGDMLPLERGVYVDAGKPCEGASRGDTLSYWGDDNGINAAQVACRIEGLSRQDDTFTLRRTCQPVGGEGTFKDRRQLKVIGRSAFVISRDATSAPAGPVFRHCGASIR